jgi:hypothetical protein
MSTAAQLLTNLAPRPSPPKPKGSDWAAGDAPSARPSYWAFIPPRGFLGWYSTPFK